MKERQDNYNVQQEKESNILMKNKNHRKTFRKIDRQKTKKFEKKILKRKAIKKLKYKNNPNLLVNSFFLFKLFSLILLNFNFKKIAELSDQHKITRNQLRKM